MEKIWTEMLEAAKAVLNERRISEYVTCGEVAVQAYASIPVQRSVSVRRETLFSI